VDSDLAEAVQALKAVFEKRVLPADFRPGNEHLVANVKARLGLSDRYASLVSAADPCDVETVTPSERIRFIPTTELEMEQFGYGRGNAEDPAMDGWKEGWVVFGHSALLGDPYFLDTTRPDAEGDCPIMTWMSGTELKPVLCASSLVCFLRILAAAMEVADDFADNADTDEEHIFREALRSKVRNIDNAALRAGHWT
jgi:hypothetical protein